MKDCLKYFVLLPVLIFFWLIPLFTGELSFDADLIKTAIVYLLYFASVLLCRLLPNRHAALTVPLAIGVGMCVLRRTAVYDTLPALLLCGWLRCWQENKKGNAVRGYFELYTDLIYLDLAAAVVRLVRYGYSFITILPWDIQAVPDLCLTAAICLMFSAFFFFGVGNGSMTEKATKTKQEKLRRDANGLIGLIPVRRSLRTLWGFCVLFLVASLLQFTNSCLVEETFLFLRTGFRLLLSPWMVLLLVVTDVLVPRIVWLKRIYGE